MEPAPIKNLIPQALSAATTSLPGRRPLRTSIESHFLAKWKLTGFETDQERAELTSMLLAAMDWCNDIADNLPPRWLTLCGYPGIGKTFLAKLSRDWLHKYGRWIYEHKVRPTVPDFENDYRTLFGYAQEGGYFFKWSRMLDTMRDGDYGHINFVVEGWVRIIDDLGTEVIGRDGLPTPFAMNTMAKLADRRVGKWTLFTTNYNRRSIAEVFEPRIASRMMRDGSVIIECSAIDYNLRRGHNQAQQSP